MEQERKETLCSGVIYVERTCSNEQVLFTVRIYLRTSSASIMLPSLDCCLEKNIKCIMFHAKRDTIHLIHYSLLHSTILKYITTISPYIV